MIYDRVRPSGVVHRGQLRDRCRSQRRFLARGRSRLFHLYLAPDLKPLLDGWQGCRARRFTENCLAEHVLYITPISVRMFNGHVEKYLFGAIDGLGAKASAPAHKRPPLSNDRRSPATLLSIPEWFRQSRGRHDIRPGTCGLSHTALQPHIAIATKAGFGHQIRTRS